MTVFTRKKIETDREKDLITGLIVSTRFCREVLPAGNVRILQVPQYKHIFTWCKDHYNSFQKAPKEDIQKIYLGKRASLDLDLSDSIETFLSALSERYSEKDSFNVDYYVAQSLEYVKSRILSTLGDTVIQLTQEGRYDEAEDLVVGYKKVSKSLSQWVNPLSEDYAEKVLLKEKGYLLKLPGAVGDLLGRHKRKHLVAIMGPMKRGKSWWLQEYLLQSVTSYLNTVIISLEQESEELSFRQYKQITGLSDTHSRIVLPVFDCALNQAGVCRKDIRIYKGPETVERGPDGLPPPFDSRMDYKVCAVCRGVYPEYEPAIWYRLDERPKLNYSNLIRTIKSFKSMYGNRIRLITYDMKTANIGTIKRDLDLLQYSENFVPDVIIIDYADILGPEDRRVTGRDAINETWQALKNLAQERSALVVTATQSNRNSMDRKRVKAIDTSEDIRKLAHVNAMALLNQTPVEKRKGIMRLAMAVARGEDFDEMEQVYVLQHFGIGQPFLDSERVYFGRREDEEND